jgi:hypothetical protein
MSHKNEKGTGKKKGGKHILTRTERQRRKRMKHLEAYWRKWYRLHPELKAGNPAHHILLLLDLFLGCLNFMFI